MTILEATNLAHSYGSTPALANVSVQISAGESVAIMGASGSGKTTLLHALAGLLQPQQGDVTFHDAGAPRSLRSMNDAQRTRLRREKFGFVFQQGLLLPELTALENVSLPLLLTGADRPHAEATATAWLARLGLAGRERNRIGELSGGQAQRVAIARAQVTDAPVVFADEPTGALDSQTSADTMTALLAATVGTGRALVLVTHDRTVATRCSRIIEMRDGALIAQWQAPAAREATEVAR